MPYKEPSPAITLEYQPAWDKLFHYENGHYVPSGPEIHDIAWYTPEAGPFSLWFIDYRIKRNPGYQEPAEEQAKPKARGHKPPRVFYARDRRYVEVNMKQLGRWVGHDLMWDADCELPTKDDCCGCCGAEVFVERLTDEMDYRWDYDENDWYDCRDSGWVEYGILACEYLV